jgi:membrane protein DedA with SNARE-associated domain
VGGPDVAVIAASSLPQPFGALAPVLDHYGYFAVGGILFFENVGLPIPGETILVAAALYAGTGRLNVVAVGVVALVCSIAGSCLGYVIGSRGGRPLIARVGRRVRLTEERLTRLEDFVNRRGVPLIIVARFIDGLRQLSGLIAGFSEMTWRRFLVATSIGAALWVACFTTLGYVAGAHVATISRYFGYFAVLAIAALVVPLLVRHLRHRRARHREQPAGEPARAPDRT